MYLKVHKPIAIAIFIVLLSSQNLFSQLTDTIPWLGKKQIEFGISCYDSGKLDEALKHFELVSKSDPEYPTACYELALTYEAKNEYEKGFSKILEADSLEPNSVNTITLKGSLLDDLERREESINLLENARIKWPYNHSLLYNLAIVYANTNQYAKAEDLLIQCIKLSPYHSGTHMLLGRINYFMGRSAQSVLAFNMGLLLNPSSNNVTKFENAVTNATNPIPAAYLYPYNTASESLLWKKLNQFCNSGIAFKNDFPYNLPTNFLINRQSLLLFRMMNFEPNEKNIYNQFYIRFFKEILNRNEADILFAYQLQNLNLDKVNSWLKANKAKSNKFVEYAQNTINEWREYCFSTINEEKKIKTTLFNDNGRAYFIGQQIQSATPTFEGDYIQINSAGSVIERGQYKNGELEGSCTLYWPSGKIKQALNFKNGKLDGTNLTYHENGKISGTYPRKDGMKEGVEKEFSLNGFVYRSEPYVNDKEEGKCLKSYPTSGWSLESNYVAGKLNGNYTEKWFNGKLKTSAVYTDSLLNGPMQNWYANGKKKNEYTYKDDYATGAFKEFHTNSTLKSEGTYNDSSQLTGNYTIYDRNGTKLSLQQGYEKGELNGLHTDYYSNGAKKDEYVYKNNIIKKITCYEPDGKIRYQADEKEGVLAFRYYFDNGQIKRTGNFVNGKREGVWNEYSGAGVITSIENWKDDMQMGEQKTFYASGSLKSVINCDSNKIHGLYKYYYPNNTLQSTAYYLKGESNGEVRNYYSNGKISNIHYMINNNISGRSFDYTIEGNLDSEFIYSEDGEITKAVIYLPDNTKKEISYQEDSLNVQINYPNGKTMYRYKIIDGLKHGLSEHYYPNGKLSSSQNFMYGKLHGDSKQWDIDGNLFSLFPYNLDKIEGYTFFYTNNKKVHSRGYYEENIEQEKYLEYYPNGKVFREISYKDDERDGPYSFYSPDSILLFSLNYEDGFICAIQIRNKQGKTELIQANNLTGSNILSYYPNGTLAAEVPLVKGILNGKLVLYYPNGTKLRERNYVDDYMSGITTDYYPNGKIKEQYENANNDMHGKYVFYSETGIKLIEGEYIADIKTGTWTYNDAAGKLKFKVAYINGNAYEIK